jgi:hypothetical protein
MEKLRSLQSVHTGPSWHYRLWQCIVCARHESSRLLSGVSCQSFIHSWKMKVSGPS